MADIRENSQLDTVAVERPAGSPVEVAPVTTFEAGSNTKVVPQDPTPPSVSAKITRQDAQKAVQVNPSTPTTNANRPRSVDTKSGDTWREAIKNKQPGIAPLN